MLLATAGLWSGCEQVQGLWPTPAGDGPLVVHHMDARPFPDMPFPNDLGTRPDPQSPTGLRINVSARADSRLERTVRAQLNRLDGFGTLQPVTVSFDTPLDLDDLAARHVDNLDWSDDAVFLVDISPDSPTFGRPVMLDMNRGNYPHLLQPDTTYFPSDPHADEPALVFETLAEDTDGNGRLDPGEDMDGDGVLDAPNVWPPGARAVDGLTTHWERETNTLILRPVVPLRERTRYAVVLTDRLRGRQGEPVRSPFAWVHHLAQTDDLRRLQDVFAAWRKRGIELDMSRVAFAWTFTTQTITGDLVAIREGLYGVGPLAWLADLIGPDATPALARDPDRSDQPYVFPLQLLVDLTETVLVPAFDISQEQARALVADMQHVSHVAQGWFSSPDFLTDADTPYIWDWVFDLDTQRGRARVQPIEIPFTLVVPKTTARHQPPFPVAIYAHGFGQARVEFLAFANVLAKYGIASAGIDAWGHGVYIGDFERSVIMSLAATRGYVPFAETFLQGRARDLDGDGKIDAGGDTFSAYAFHTRDVIRQSLVDHLQLVRVLRNFDGFRTWDLDQDGDGRLDLAGDFDGDGRVDAGGAQAMYVWGSSMGGIHSTILGALEPTLRAAAPIAGGGGLTYLTTRSKQASVRVDTVMRALGPVIVGEPSEDGTEVEISLLAGLARKLRRLPIGRVSGLEPGDRVRVVNLDRDEVHAARVNAERRFAMHLKADAQDRFEIVLETPAGEPLERLTSWSHDVTFGGGDAPTYRAGDGLRTPVEGWGLRRGSPDLRRLIGLAQAVLDPADPANWVRHYFTEPLPIRPQGPRSSDLLVIATLGDPNDPIDTQTILARTAGILPYLEEDERFGMSPNDWLIQRHVVEGICGLGRYPPNDQGREVLFDPDALADLTPEGNGFDAPRPPPGFELRQTVQTPSGQSGIRFGHMRPCGSHSFFITDPSNRFNADEYLNSLAGFFFASRGELILDDACHEDSSCPLR